MDFPTPMLQGSVVKVVSERLVVISTVRYENDDCIIDEIQFCMTNMPNYDRTDERFAIWSSVKNLVLGNPVSYYIERKDERNNAFYGRLYVKLDSETLEDVTKLLVPIRRVDYENECDTESMSSSSTVREVQEEQEQGEEERDYDRRQSVTEKDTLPDRFNAIVMSVLSGSELSLRPLDSDLDNPSNLIMTVTLAGIVCPRPGLTVYGGQPFGEKAKAFVSNLCLKKHVRVEVEYVDRYGHYSVWIWTNGLNLNNSLVENGLSTVKDGVTVDGRNYYMQMKNSEDTAKIKKRNIWKTFSEYVHETPESIPAKTSTRTFRKLSTPTRTSTVFKTKRQQQQSKKCNGCFYIRYWVGLFSIFFLAVLIDWNQEQVKTETHTARNYMKPDAETSSGNMKDKYLHDYVNDNDQISATLPPDDNYQETELMGFETDSSSANGDDTYSTPRDVPKQSEENSQYKKLYAILLSRNVYYQTFINYASNEKDGAADSKQRGAQQTSDNQRSKPIIQFMNEMAKFVLTVGSDFVYALVEPFAIIVQYSWSILGWLNFF